MEFVTIMVKQEEGGEYAPKKVPAFHVAGPWAVTTSASPMSPGFAVTYAPTGAVAWPQKPGPASMPEAVKMANRLSEVWSGTGEIPRARRNVIAKIVGF